MDAKFSLDAVLYKLGRIMNLLFSLLFKEQYGISRVDVRRGWEALERRVSMLKSDECLQRAIEAEQWAKAEGRDELHALFLKSAESWRALATVAQLAEEALTTEFD